MSLAALFGFCLLLTSFVFVQCRDLVGSGSTLVESFQQGLSLAYRISPFHMIYTGTGSGAGKKAVSAGQVDFAWSESPLSDAEQAAAPDVFQLPLFISAVGVLYNFPGLKPSLSALNLTLQLLVDIYAERLTNWRDPAILAINGRLANLLPNTTILRYVRGESSGSSEVFTNALKSANSSWTASGTLPKWPNPTGLLRNASGTNEMAQSIIWNPGSMGYVGLPTTLVYGLPTAQFIDPAVSMNIATPLTLAAASEAASHFESSIPSSLALTIVGADPPAYPISAFVYLMLNGRMADCEKAYWLQRYVQFCLSASTKAVANANGFAFLGATLQTRIIDRLLKMQCVEGTNTFLLKNLKQRYDPDPVIPDVVDEKPKTIITAVVAGTIGLIGALIAVWVFYRRSTKIKRAFDSAPGCSGMAALMFTDIQGSTKLWEAHENAMKLALEIHNDTIRNLLGGYGGYEVKTQGDSFMIAFDDCNAAVGFAMEVQSKLLCMPWPEEMLANPNCAKVQDAEGVTIWNGIRVRIGIHFGPVEREYDVNTRRIDYFGPTANCAARVESLAYGGQVVISQEVYDTLQQTEEIETMLLGEFLLKGIKTPKPIYQANSLRLHERKFDPINPEKAAAEPPGGEDTGGQRCNKCNRPLSCKCEKEARKKGTADGSVSYVASMISGTITRVSHLQSHRAGRKGVAPSSGVPPLSYRSDGDSEG